MKAKHHDMNLLQLQKVRMSYLMNVAEAKDLLKEGKLTDYLDKLKECEKLSLLAREMNQAFCN